MSSTRRGTDGSGDDSHEADSAIPTAASHAPLTPEQPIVPDDPTVIRRPTSSDPVEKQITVISGGGKILPTSNSISTNELGQMLEGEMLGPLRLDKFIGGGGMGAVFRAHDTNLSRTVAVKILLGRGSGGDLKKRFQLEAQPASTMKTSPVSFMLVNTTIGITSFSNTSMASTFAT
ncbi:MAG: hypothetical protein MK179_16935 [Pirellulaceae bacterium]|nr:hypothetical protein [Pirellulaceae bacterium]